MICNIVGARPNFIKMAPVVQALTRRGLNQILVHTGQHYDQKMSAIFFDELKLPQPDIYLGVGSASHAVQTARIMELFEEICFQHHFELVIVAGDVNSTLACALTAAKLHLPVAHIESGLRSFDRQMPEEINRVLTDHLSDLLFVTEESGLINLQKEGIESAKVHFVGNTMIDTLHTHLPKALEKQPWTKFDLKPGAYVLFTLHRPANVDDEVKLREIIAALEEIGGQFPVLFPAHPRTKNQLNAANLPLEHIQVIEPLGYLDFLGLMAKANCVLTDSGGIQEETTALKVPCVTIRENTERPVTIQKGTNQLAGVQQTGILAAFNAAVSKDFSRDLPDLWDGRAARRVAAVVADWLAV